MSLEQSIQMNTEALQSLSELIAKLVNHQESTAYRKEKAKTDEPAAPVAKPAAKAKPAATGAGDFITHLREAQKRSSKAIDAAKQVLAEFEVKNINQLDPEAVPNAIRRLDELIAE